MSSFKRKTAAKPAQALPGTRLSSATPSTVVTSTGIPSLDDILGGGLPLSCSLLILAPDHHSSYGELVQKYFIAQGLSCGQNICIVGDNAGGYVKDIMWFPSFSQSQGEIDHGNGEEDDEGSEKIKIAWRYANMKQFQTTIGSSSQGDEFCQTFDLTSRIPQAVIDQAMETGQLTCIQATDELDSVLDRIIETLESRSTNGPVRLCIRSLGSPEWGGVGGQDILRFLHFVRSILRRYPHACASFTLPPYWSTESGGVGWIQKLGWVSDATISLVAFSSNPSLSAAFPSHHGLLHIHNLPAPHTLLPPSDKYSTLRGLSSTSGSGCGENNLAFRCTRKRLIIETLHLDVEGGVSERRTNRPARTYGEREDKDEKETGAAAVAVDIEAGKRPDRKERKRVGFRSELYDF